MTRPDTKPAHVDIPAALAHLASVGITEQVLTTAGADVTDPASLRLAVEQMLLAIVTDEAIADERQLRELQAAYNALNSERPDEIGDLLDTYVTYIAGRPVVGIAPNRVRDLPGFGDRCLEAD